MICPTCLVEGEVAYSILSNSFICLAAGCGWEHEIEPAEARELLDENALWECDGSLERLLARIVDEPTLVEAVKAGQESRAGRRKERCGDYGAAVSVPVSV